MKRILSLDGGGIRGMFSLQILSAIEAHFRQERRRDDLVLADVFDMFAGTSTGALIATALSWGMSVGEIEALYLKCAAEIFSKETWYRRWKTKYRAEPMTQLFARTFVDADGNTDSPARLGSARLRTLLLIVMRNASTGSPWPVSNNPHAPFNDRARPDCNLDIPIWQLLRASTAAPWYFPPADIALGDQSFLFVDGAMTPYNNPTLIAVLMATMPAYGLAWPASREDLHVVSIGTGAGRARLPRKTATDVNLLDAVRYLAPALIGAISVEQDFMCRVLGDCVYGAPLDAEVNALQSPSLLAAHEQKFSYVRYDSAIAWPADLSQPDGEPAPEPELDDLTVIPQLQQLGREYAAQHVRADHLSPRRSLS